MKRTFLFFCLSVAVLVAGCVTVERRNLRPEISPRQLANLGPEYGPKAAFMAVNEYTCTHAVVYLYEGQRRRSEVWPNVGGGNMVLRGYIAAYKLQNSPGRNFPVVAGLPQKPILLDADRYYTAFVFIYHGAFGKMYCDPYVQVFRTDKVTDRDRFSFSGTAGASELRANYILRVQGSNQAAYPGPFQQHMEIRPQEMIGNGLQRFFQR